MCGRCYWAMVRRAHTKLKWKRHTIWIWVSKITAMTYLWFTNDEHRPVSIEIREEYAVLLLLPLLLLDRIMIGNFVQHSFSSSFKRRCDTKAHKMYQKKRRIRFASNCAIIWPDFRKRTHTEIGVVFHFGLFFHTFWTLFYIFASVLTLNFSHKYGICTFDYIIHHCSETIHFAFGG